MVFDKASVDEEYIDVELGYRVPAEWCTEISPEEPTEPGYYKFTYDKLTQCSVAYKGYGGNWLTLGTAASFTWENLIKNGEDFKLLSVERIS